MIAAVAMGRLDSSPRALVAGATGFIGGRLAAALDTAGWEVRCLVRDRRPSVRVGDDIL
ncbi:MAG: dependent epimerase/dehydratase family [Solirubrobacteraceae bacterium]|jgi:uncharacterized protein YbjT (DUF2867 family)|nr:dependent epimerase/dehydratase family [Solirubrobacteraceae bacterium]